MGHQQDARVQVVGSVRLRERLLPVAPRLRQHIVGDRLTELPPSVDGTVQPELVMGTNGAIEGHPRHHLRVGEVPERPSDLPDAGVLLTPAVLEPSEQLQHQRPDVLVRRSTLDPQLVDGVQDLAVDVQLELRRCGVPDPYRRRALISRQPVQLELVQAAFPGEAVHHLDVRRDRRRRHARTTGSTSRPHRAIRL